MNRTRFVALLVSLIVLMTSCKTDFDVISEWKDITVVYGLIDQTDTAHLIRINKAFLGPGNALHYAAIEDSSSYGNNLEVKLNDILFDTTTMYPKDSGVFSYQHQILYISKAKLFEDSLYTLKIRNLITGKAITASSPLIQDFDIEKPRPSATNSFECKRSITSEQEFKWTSATNGKRYQITVRFFFKESSAPGDTLVRSVEWVQNPEKSENAYGGEALTSIYYNEKFFTTCINQIPYSDASREAAVSTRQVLRIDFIFTVIGDEMNTYLEVNEPSGGVLQEKPEYTNIDNGIGIFSCRYTKIRSKKLGQLTESDLIGITNLKFVKNPDN
ncbi:MAG: hypothetical protein ACOYMF_06365 [Bacteroidales bacterium]